MMPIDDFNIGIGLSLKKDYLLAIKEAMQQARTNIYTGHVDLAIVFTSIEFSHPNTLNTINGLLGSTPVIGCSSAAIISNKGIFKQGLVIMLIDFPEGVYLNTAHVQDIKTKTSLNAGDELGEKLLSDFPGRGRELTIVFSDGLIEDGSNLISGLQEKLGISFPLIGASASDDMRFLKTEVYHNQFNAGDAACGILLGGKLNFGLGIKHGWKPLGKPRQITKSVRNVVYEIDDTSAINVYEEYFACDLAKLKKELKRISILYPIGIYLPGTKEYLLRNILSIQDNGSLIFQGSVPEGSQIRLMIGTKESCLAATKDALDEAKKGLFARPAKCVLVFDSVSRYMLLGRHADKELDMIKEVFGQDTPIIGLYTYGEQAPLKSIDYKGKAYFHNQSIAILALGG